VLNIVGLLYYTIDIHKPFTENVIDLSSEMYRSHVILI
jgi:hypothetical protein